MTERMGEKKQIPEMEGDFEKLNKMIKYAIKVATYQEAALQPPGVLKLYPDDARYLAGLLQELRQYREIYGTLNRKDS